MVSTFDSLPRAARHYRLPELLQDIRLLDLLELCGSTVHASAVLSLSQPTVSRRYRALAADFNLERNLRQCGGCCFGSSATMRLLRLGCRAHRLACGVARIGGDLLHQPLLAGLDWLLPSPPRFRCVESWLELVRQGVLDGALISGLELKAAPPLDVTDLELVPLGALPLALAVHPKAQLPAQRDWPPVLVPHRGIAPGLQRALQGLGLTLKSASHRRTTPQSWLDKLQSRQLAIAVSTAVLDPNGWGQGLQRLDLPEPLTSPVLLALPKRCSEPAVLQHTARQLQGQAAFNAHCA
jgi:DNA-binding transcriptional LysR family regulator